MSVEQKRAAVADLYPGRGWKVADSNPNQTRPKRQKFALFAIFSLVKWYLTALKAHKNHQNSVRLGFGKFQESEFCARQSRSGAGILDIASRFGTVWHKIRLLKRVRLGLLPAIVAAMPDCQIHAIYTSRILGRPLSAGGGR